MSEELSATYPATPEASAGLSQERVFAALALDKRRTILRLLLERGPMGVQEVSAVFRRQETLMGRHLITLANAGLVTPVLAPDGDGRRQYYRIPKNVVGKDAAGRTVLDYGCVVVRV